MDEEIETIMSETPEITQADYEGMRLVLHLARNGRPFDSELIVNHLLRKALTAAIRSFEARQTIAEVPTND